MAYWWVGIQSNAGTCECDDLQEIAKQFGNQRFCGETDLLYQDDFNADVYGFMVGFDDPFTAGEFMRAVKDYDDNVAGNSLYLLCGCDPDCSDDGFGGEMYEFSPGFTEIHPWADKSDLYEAAPVEYPTAPCPTTPRY